MRRLPLPALLLACFLALPLLGVSLTLPTTAQAQVSADQLNKLSLENLTRPPAPTYRAPAARDYGGPAYRGRSGHGGRARSRVTAGRHAGYRGTAHAQPRHHGRPPLHRGPAHASPRTSYHRYRR